eukprot:sb/3477342/
MVSGGWYSDCPLGRSQHTSHCSPEHPHPLLQSLCSPFRSSFLNRGYVIQIKTTVVIWAYTLVSWCPTRRHQSSVDKDQNDICHLRDVSFTKSFNFHVVNCHGNYGNHGN